MLDWLQRRWPEVAATITALIAAAAAFRNEVAAILGG